MGASIASRTAELDLQHSAVRMIDTSNATGWVTPPSDTVQAVVVSLPARARIDRAGVVTVASSAAVRDLRIDFSLDGETFTRAVMLNAKQADGEQAVPVVPPVEAQYVRFSTLNGYSRFLTIRQAVVNGTLLPTPAPGAIDGCWSIDGQPATFHSDRATVLGYAGGMRDMNLDGGSDGRFYRFAWTRDKQYGLAAMSVTPDGKHLAALVWHEEAIDIDQFYADDWLGDRGGCPANKDVDVFLTYLQRLGYFPLYALRFSDDGTLDDDASSPELARIAKLIAANPQLQIRFVAHELTHPSAQENLAVAQKKIATLRDALLRRGVPAKAGFVAVGQEQPHRAGTSPLIRAMYSSVDLELRR
ncbi:MAG TPA: discoidin domain-containing protein [Thermoanaerobaculia bacterium]|nr:discoidin domain-containing protein [Thermoanaerobaculia bacterium]